MKHEETFHERCRKRVEKRETKKKEIGAKRAMEIKRIKRKNEKIHAQQRAAQDAVLLLEYRAQNKRLDAWERWGRARDEKARVCEDLICYICYSLY